MKQRFIQSIKTTFILSMLSLSFGTFAQVPAGHSVVEGRWDITITKRNVTTPAWLEVTHSGLKTLTGHFVGDGGSSRPISKVNFVTNVLSFSIPPQWENSDKDLSLEAELKDDKLMGTLTTPLGEKFRILGVRAPKLWREKAPVWGTPISLFNGKNMDGWQTLGPDNQWVAENGIMKSPRTGANIRTVQTFQDFKLHAEFRVPKESNSGLYLRGRYEIQVADSKGLEPAKDQLGAVYGFIAPLENVAKEAGEWQTYDIELVGRNITVTLNGKTVIYKAEIPGITGGALDSNEGEAGPIMIQGDHGPVEYRNLIITPAK
ncbi:3-keto-disaccharide hydrolase [Aquirufa sp. Wall-65K1]